jgi:hypothetical protein
MAPITWLASYPKSGNTWLRAFLANYLNAGASPVDINELPRFSHGEMAGGLFEQLAGRPLAALSDEQLQRLRPAVHRAIAQLPREPNFVKTHNAFASLFGVPTVTMEATRAAIYVIRNPLDVVISYADHYGVDLDRAIGQMQRADNRTRTAGRTVFQLFGRWSDHVSGWTRAPGLRLHLMRYEDMLAAPEPAFAGVLAFLGLAEERERLLTAIRYSEFRELRAQEARAGFHERSRQSQAFFRAGRAGQWRELLSPAQVERIVAAHGETMAQYGYLP